MFENCDDSLYKSTLVTSKERRWNEAGGADCEIWLLGTRFLPALEMTESKPLEVKAARRIRD